MLKDPSFIYLATILPPILLGFIGAVIWSTILEKIRKFPNTIFTSLAFLFLTTVPTLYQVGGLLMLVGSTYLTYREKEVVYDN